MNLLSQFELLIVILLGTCGQLALKYALQNNGAREKTGNLLGALFVSPYFWGWFICYALATFLWLVVLKTIPLSKAFPILGLSFALIPLASKCLLKETITPSQWAGIIAVVIGVGLVAQT